MSSAYLDKSIFQRLTLPGESGLEGFTGLGLSALAEESRDQLVCQISTLETGDESIKHTEHKLTFVPHGKASRTARFSRPFANAANMPKSFSVDNTRTRSGVERHCVRRRIMCGAKMALTIGAPRWWVEECALRIRRKASRRNRMFDRTLVLSYSTGSVLPRSSS